jgi:hypothetical protein
MPIDTRPGCPELAFPRSTGRRTNVPHLTKIHLCPTGCLLKPRYRVDGRNLSIDGNGVDISVGGEILARQGFPVRRPDRDGFVGKIDPTR